MAAITQLGLHGPQMAYAGFTDKTAAPEPEVESGPTGGNVPQGSLFDRDRTFTPTSPRSFNYWRRWSRR